MINLNSKIEQLKSLVQGGVDALVNAGKLLIEMEKEEPQICWIISKKEPLLDINRLKVIKLVGEGEINPYLLLDSSPGAQKLITMPPEIQEKYMKEPVELAVITSSGTNVQHVPARELSRPQVEVAFNSHRARTVAEQVEMLKNKAVIREQKTTKRYEIVGDRVIFNPVPHNEYTREQLLEIAEKLPKPDIASLESVIKKNQVAGAASWMQRQVERR